MSNFYALSNIGFQSFPSQSYTDSADLNKNPRTIGNTDGGQYTPCIGNFHKTIVWEWGSSNQEEEITTIVLPPNQQTQGSTIDLDIRNHTISAFNIEGLIIRLDNTAIPGSDVYFSPQIFNVQGVINWNTANMDANGIPTVTTNFELPAEGDVTDAFNLTYIGYFGTSVVSSNPFDITVVKDSDADIYALQIRATFSNNFAGTSDSEGENPVYFIKGQYLLI